MHSLFSPPADGNAPAARQNRRAAKVRHLIFWHAGLLQPGRRGKRKLADGLSPQR